MNTRDQIKESIKHITKVAFGYPKRLVIDPRNKNAAAWQAYFDLQYNLLCEQLQMSSTIPLFDAPHST